MAEDIVEQLAGLLKGDGSEADATIKRAIYQLSRAKGTGEAVAWRHRSDMDGIWTWAYTGDPAQAEVYRRKGHEVEPLYASPPVALPRSTTDPVCFDCGRDYGDEHGFPDLVIEQTAWNAISPDGDGNGLLCPSCLCKRLHVNGIECVGTFRSGPISAPPVALPEGNLDLTASGLEGPSLAAAGWRREDTHLWPIVSELENPPTIRATANGSIGIQVGGLTIYKTLEEWHALALSELDARTAELRSRLQPAAAGEAPCAAAVNQSPEPAE